MQLQLLSHDESQRRFSKVRSEMEKSGIDAVLICDNADLYYLTGRVFAGYVWIPLKGEPIYFVKRPVEMQGDGVVEIRKPEQIPASTGIVPPAVFGLELDTVPYAMISRLQNLFPESRLADASAVMRASRAVKTDEEVRLIAESAEHQDHVYSLIPSFFTEGMRDFELQIEIERASRLDGCLGLFRVCGPSMELFMGNVLAGDNADEPSPYDFAMGGAGMDPSLPVGCNGSVIRSGTTVMVDVNGNYTGYMSDMTRTYYLGDISSLARKAHQLSVDICRRLEREGVPGAEARRLYEIAEEMVAEAGLKDYFMGHRQKAGFIGHGVGIEINELPVIAPRSRDVLKAGNVIALEPKFVIPHTGAVGIENTYVVTPQGLKRLTEAPEQLISLI